MLIKLAFVNVRSFLRHLNRELLTIWSAVYLNSFIDNQLNFCHSLIEY